MSTLYWTPYCQQIHSIHDNHLEWVLVDVAFSAQSTFAITTKSAGRSRLVYSGPPSPLSATVDRCCPFLQDHGYGKDNLCERLKGRTPLDRRSVAIDKKGANKHIFTTEALSKALDAYREAVYNASKAAKEQLKQLATLLVEEYAMPLSAAARFNQALIGAEAHADHCGTKKGWVVPVVGRPPVYDTAREGGSSSSSTVVGKGYVNGMSSSRRNGLVELQNGNGSSSSGVRSNSSSSSSSNAAVSHGQSVESVHIQAEGMYPYWMDAADLHTVRNDIDLSSMMVLTGPNMAGKSGGGGSGGGG